MNVDSRGNDGTIRGNERINDAKERNLLLVVGESNLPSGVRAADEDMGNYGTSSKASRRCT